MIRIIEQYTYSVRRINYKYLKFTYTYLPIGIDLLFRKINQEKYINNFIFYYINYQKYVNLLYFHA